jgi:hypothetical protein
MDCHINKETSIRYAKYGYFYLQLTFYFNEVVRLMHDFLTGTTETDSWSLLLRQQRASVQET